METLQWVVECFPYHQIVLCGDPGYQTSPIRILGVNDHIPCTVARLKEAGIACYEYQWSYRCKCDVLRHFCNEVRAMITVRRMECVLNSKTLSYCFKRPPIVTTPFFSGASKLGCPANSINLPAAPSNATQGGEQHSSCTGARHRLSSKHRLS